MLVAVKIAFNCKSKKVTLNFLPVLRTLAVDPRLHFEFRFDLKPYRRPCQKH